MLLNIKSSFLNVLLFYVLYVMEEKRIIDSMILKNHDELISQGVSDMHCLSDYYLADELMLEFFGDF